MHQGPTARKWQKAQRHLCCYTCTGLLKGRVSGCDLGAPSIEPKLWVKMTGVNFLFTRWEGLLQ